LIKFIEQWGTGTNEMVKRCLEWGLPEPEFEYVAGDVVVTFMKTKLTEEYLDKLRKDLEDIVKAGIVKPVGEKRGRKYVLK
jgi:ATP-dependent DNA helicase RecG